MIWNFCHYRTQDPPDAQTIYTFESRGFGGNAEIKFGNILLMRKEFHDQRAGSYKILVVKV